MRIKRLAAALAIAGTITGLGAAFSAPADAGQSRDVHGYFNGDGVRLYKNVPTGSNDVVNGLGYHNQRATAHCNVLNGVGTVTWVYVTDDDTGVSGYAYFTLVPNADHYC